MERLPQAEHRDPQHQDPFHAAVFIIYGRRCQHHHLIDPFIKFFLYGCFPFESFPEHVPVDLGQGTDRCGSLKYFGNIPSLGPFMFFHPSPEVLGDFLHIPFRQMGPYIDIAIFPRYPYVIGRNDIHIGDEPAGTQQFSGVNSFVGIFPGSFGFLPGRGCGPVMMVLPLLPGRRLRGISFFLRPSFFPVAGTFQVIPHNGGHAGSPVAQGPLLPFNKAFPEKVSERKGHDKCENQNGQRKIGRQFRSYFTLKHVTSPFCRLYPAAKANL